MMSTDFETCVYDIFHTHLRRDWSDDNNNNKYLLLH